MNRPDSEQHPVAFGLLALVGVAVVVGLILGLAALAGSKVMGVGEETASSGSTAEEASMFLPRPERTRADGDPEITLAPGEETPEESSDGADDEAKKDKKKQQADQQISLQAGQTAVSPMEQIDLTGVYPSGEGAILQVQRFESGSWEDFPVTVQVSDQTFATYVQTGQSGVQRFRVLDTSSDKASNEVRVKVG